MLVGGGGGAEFLAWNLRPRALKILLQEHRHYGILIIAVFAAGETVALVIGVDGPYGSAVVADLGGDLHRFGEGHARIIAAVNDQQRRANLPALLSGSILAKTSCIFGSRSSPYSARRKSWR